MNSSPKTHDFPIRGTLVRGLWAVMAAMHAPALVSAWRGWMENGFQAERVAGLLFLAVAMAFFLAKLLGVACLKLHLDRRSAVALCLAVALLHVGCLDVEGGPYWLSNCAVVLVATSAFCAACPVVNRLWDRALTSAPLRCVLPIIGRSRGAVWLDDSRPRCWVLFFQFFHLRAPPA